MLIETCPKCGAAIESLILTTYPAIPAKRCNKCGWHWEGKMEPLVCVPFKEEVYVEYYDTIGDYHWIGTYTGEHVIKGGK